MTAQSTSAPAPAAAGRSGRLVRAIAVAAVLVLLAAAVVLRGRARFDAYVASDGGEQEHVVPSNQGVDLIFVDHRRSGTAYRVVYTRTADRLVRRYSSRTRASGTLSRIHIAHVGRRPSHVTVRWLVAGRTRARWAFTIQPRRRARP